MHTGVAISFVSEALAIPSALALFLVDRSPLPNSFPRSALEAMEQTPHDRVFEIHSDEGDGYRRTFIIKVGKQAPAKEIKELRAAPLRQSNQRE